MMRDRMLTIETIDQNFSVCQVEDYSLVDLDTEYCFIGKTDREKSLVCITEKIPANATRHDDGWKAFQVQGTLDFSLVGVLSGIATVLAESGIPIFAVSTYDTDYVFVKEENYGKGLKALETAGYQVTGTVRKINIRRFRTDDTDFVLKLNEENVEMLAPMDINRLSMFGANAEQFLIAEENGEKAGFLIALRENIEIYDSENYRWFRAHYPSFLYIDRIVLDGKHRGSGIGRALYEEVFRHAKESGVDVVTAEIDTIPYNGASLKFHSTMGFREVGTQAVRNGSVEVSLQARML